MSPELRLIILNNNIEYIRSIENIKEELNN